MIAEQNTHLLTGKEGKDFDLETAAKWTKNHRDKHPNETISHFFGREILQKILAQENCVGIRFYYAYDEEGKKHLVITGAKSDGSDLVPKTLGTPLTKDELKSTTIHTNYVADQSLPCPGSPNCPKGALAG